MHVKSKTVKAHYYVALTLLQLPKPDLDSLKSDLRYQHFSVAQLTRIARQHGYVKKQIRKKVPIIHSRDLQDRNHLVPLIGLIRDEYGAAGVQPGESHSGKPDVGVDPSTKAETEVHIYANMYGLASY
jgi:hypothetical protein